MAETDNDDPSVEEIAEEIRRAMPGAAAVRFARPAESIRALATAERHVVPGLEPGTKLALAKKYLLRLLRIVTRSQGTYNAAVLEALRELDQRMADLRREGEDLRRRVGGLDGRLAEVASSKEDLSRRQDHAFAELAAGFGGRFESLREESARELRRLWSDAESDFQIVRSRIDADETRLQREIDLVHARLSREERGLPRAAESGPTVSAASAKNVSARLPDGFYIRFEEQFRGIEGDIRERQGLYAKFFRGAPGTVLDCGCGRGEFLEVLRASGIAAEGVDTNAIAVELAAGKGLGASLEDLFESLRRRSSILGGVAALQVVEHLEPEAVYEFLELAFAALAPGGRLLLETINPDSVYALKAYRLDPTHRWPVPSGTLELMAREVGFGARRVEMLSPVPENERLVESDENDRKLNRLLFAPQDYALFAEKPR